MRACCKRSRADALEAAAKLVGDDDLADEIRSIARRHSRKPVQALIDLFAAQPCATLAEVDRAIWPDRAPGSRHCRANFINLARRALAAEGKHINSVHGVGYRIESERRWLPKSTPLNPTRIKAVPDARA